METSKTSNNRTYIFWAVLLSVIATGGLIYYAFSNRSTSEAPQSGHSQLLVKATLYKDPTCSCCMGYVAYLKRNGFDVNVVKEQDMEPIKQKFHVPADMESCHTVVIGDVFVEGHVPIKAVRKLLNNPRGFAGIALPGMPAGSPGMPGVKAAPFDVHSVSVNGKVANYLEI